MNAAEQPRKTHEPVWSIAALLALGSSCALSYVLFERFFGINYFYWYARSGPIIGLAAAALGMVFGGFDEDSGFVSWHPLEYVGSYLQVAGVLIQSSGASARGISPRLAFVDSLLVVPLSVLLGLSVCAWLVLIVPLQYFLFLLCGALSRQALLQTPVTEFRKTRGEATAEQAQTDPGRFDRAWLDNGLRKKPYTLACMFAAALLYVIASLLVPAQA